jgi:hypothetical protein
MNVSLDFEAKFFLFQLQISPHHLIFLLQHCKQNPMYTKLDFLEKCKYGMKPLPYEMQNMLETLQ